MFINIFNNINKREAVKPVLPWAKTIITLSGNSRGLRENKNLSSDGSAKYCNWKIEQRLSYLCEEQHLDGEGYLGRAWNTQWKQEGKKK